MTEQPKDLHVLEFARRTALAKEVICHAKWADLARLGVSTSTVQRVKRGEEVNLSFNTVERVLRELGGG